MTRRSVDFRALWPWLLIVLVLVSGLVIASCSSGAAAVATPTPTKTPRPAGSQTTATPQPTEIARSETPTNAPTATNPPAATKAPAATDAPKPTCGNNECRLSDQHAPAAPADCLSPAPTPRWARRTTASRPSFGGVPRSRIAISTWSRMPVSDGSSNTSPGKTSRAPKRAASTGSAPIASSMRRTNAGSSCSCASAWTPIGPFGQAIHRTTPATSPISRRRSPTATRAASRPIRSGTSPIWRANGARSAPIRRRMRACCAQRTTPSSRPTRTPSS